MAMDVIEVDPVAPSPEVIERAADVMARGGLVVFPTETVYGVAARVDRVESMATLRRVKSREDGRAFTVHIGRREELHRFSTDPGIIAKRLSRRAWPGPLTLILAVPDPASSPVMEGLNGDASSAIFYDNSVGLRCPDDAVALALLQAIPAPVVAASANPAGAPPPQSGRAVLETFGDAADLLLDTGTTRYAKPSTIVRVDGMSFEVVRAGVLDKGIIERMCALRLLFVCTGNTCRSPMAEGIARRILAERLGCGVDELADRGILVSSAGVAGGIGGASPHAVKVMAARGIDITGHSSRHVEADDVLQADHVLAMTKGHRDQLLAMCPSAADKIALLADDADVVDPVGGSEADYEACAARIEESLRLRMEELLS